MEQHDLLRFVVAALERLVVPHMLVGSFGSGAYGEPRFTYDIDVVLDLPAARVSDFCAAFPPPDFSLTEYTVRESVRTRFPFNILHPTTGHKVDCSFPPAGEWGATQLARRRRIPILPGLEAYTAAPEDVILGKLWYYAEGGSDKHLRDIAGILRVTGDGVDRAEVRRWAARLGYLEVWDAILARVDAPDPPPGPGVP